jgi:hypothetical protein
MIQEHLRKPQLARFPFLFIVSYGRSGSTLLCGLLNSLPGYCIRGENGGALLHIFRSAKQLGIARSMHNGTPSLPDNPWFGAEQIVPDLFIRRAGDAFFEAVLRPPAEARCVGFKEIRYTRRVVGDKEFAPFLDFIAKLFPGCVFVFNSREIEATSRSGFWREEPQDAVKRILENAEERFSAYRERFPDRTFDFSYDRLLEDVGEFRRLCQFLGEPFDEEKTLDVISRRHSI